MFKPTFNIFGQGDLFEEAKRYLFGLGERRGRHGLGRFLRSRKNKKKQGSGLARKRPHTPEYGVWNRFDQMECRTLKDALMIAGQVIEKHGWCRVRIGPYCERVTEVLVAEDFFTLGYGSKIAGDQPYVIERPV